MLVFGRLRPRVEAATEGGSLMKSASRLWPLTALVAAGCGPVEYEEIDGPYRLVATDIDWDMAICYDLGDSGCAGRVPQTVFAVGYDSRYVVAARHPHEFSSTSLDKSRTEYFYILRAADGPNGDTDKVVRGPFDRATFDRETRRLGLPALDREMEGLK